MLNTVTLQGRLTAKPELKVTPSGAAVTSFTLAVDRDTKDESGNRQADFINIVAWKSTAEFIEKYFDKGSQIIIEGRLQVRKWQDGNGNNRYSTEVVARQVHFCGGKSEHQTTTAQTPYSANSNEVSFEELGADDDLPF